MTESKPPEIESSPALRSAIVAVSSTVPDDALTAPVLGTERSGTGACIRADGVVVTIGYLVIEAREVWLTTGTGRAIPGDVLAYDQESGLGLVRALGPLGVEPLALAAPGGPGVAAEVRVCGFGSDPIDARVVARQEFAGYWEYVIDDALFTAPAHPDWGGAALVDQSEALCGIGSLLVRVQGPSGASDANMMVPVDLITPVLDDLIELGVRPGPPRPWVGAFVQPIAGRLVIAGLYDDCPAASAGLRIGDVITEVSGEPVDDLSVLFRRIWALGPAGVEVPLTVVRDDGEQRSMRVISANRADCMRRGPLH